MPLITSQRQRQRILIFVFLIIIIVAAGVLFFGVFRGGPGQEAPTEIPGQPETATTTQQKIIFPKEFLESDLLEEFEEYERVSPPESYGRDNPFEKY